MMNQMMSWMPNGIKREEIKEAAPMVFREAEVESGATAVVLPYPV